MDRMQYQLIVGGLLHDIGKILRTSETGPDHCKTGADFLKRCGLTDPLVGEQVAYHHRHGLAAAQIDPDSPAYITFVGNRVAAGLDRRESRDVESVFRQDQSLYSIFNRLNGNDEVMVYRPARIVPEGEINEPQREHGTFGEAFYRDVEETIAEVLKAFRNDEVSLNRLIETLEETLSFLSSSPEDQDSNDIPLFDHMKMTAAFNSCIYQYLREMPPKQTLKEVLFDSEAEFYTQQTFLMCSIDISGIQSFIYTAVKRKALRTLKARSFYLEVMMEHMIDLLLGMEELSRVNLLYSGGGHAYVILPNTDRTKRILKEFQDRINEWFIRNYKTELYAAVGSCPCSAYDLQNVPEGSYRRIFQQLSKAISHQKLHRYSAKELRMLNASSAEPRLRECKVCGRTDLLSNEDVCGICGALESMGIKIETAEYFTIWKKRPKKSCVYLPGDYYLTMDSLGEVREFQYMAGYIRTYAKNRLDKDIRMASKLWVGDYHEGNCLMDMAQQSEGIRRLAVLRADIDNLGQAFVHGFEHPKYGSRFTTISRTAAFSRKMSLFFKLHINSLLKELDSKAMIVYSGGDDVFVVGAWKDVLDFSMHLVRRFRSFSQGTLTLSAGIGIFDGEYPLRQMAMETGELEELAKDYPGKNAVTLFGEGHTYSWDIFKTKVLGEKLKLMEDWFGTGDSTGMHQIYRMADYLRQPKEDKIHLARFAYLLAGLEPDETADAERKKLFRTVSRTMYRWMKNEEDSRQLLTAIQIYVYLNRGKTEEYHHEN